MEAERVTAEHHWAERDAAAEAAAVKIAEMAAHQAAGRVLANSLSAQMSALQVREWHSDHSFDGQLSPPPPSPPQPPSQPPPPTLPVHGGLLGCLQTCLTGSHSPRIDTSPPGTATPYHALYHPLEYQPTLHAMRHSRYGFHPPAAFEATTSPYACASASMATGVPVPVPHHRLSPGRPSPRGVGLDFGPSIRYASAISQHQMADSMPVDLREAGVTRDWRSMPESATAARGGDDRYSPTTPAAMKETRPTVTESQANGELRPPSAQPLADAPEPFHDAAARAPALCA